jgi:hypothetical protein
MNLKSSKALGGTDLIELRRTSLRSVFSGAQNATEARIIDLTAARIWHVLA